MLARVERIRLALADGDVEFAEAAPDGLLDDLWVALGTEWTR